MSTREGSSASIKKSSHRLITLQTDGDVVGVTRVLGVSGSGEKVRACGPPWLILGEARIACDFFEGCESRGRIVSFCNGQRAIDGHHGRR